MHTSPSYQPITRAGKPKRRKQIKCPTCGDWVKNIRLHVTVHKLKRAA